MPVKTGVQIVQHRRTRPQLSFPPMAPYSVRHLVGSRPAPRTRNRPDERPPEPAGKERKVKMSPALKAAWNAAMETLEMGDMIDAFWETLPDSLKDQTEKTGTVSDSGRNPGYKYSSDYDKARLLLKHWDKFTALQLQKGLTAILLNELQDKIIGAVQKRGDQARKRAGGTGWGLSF